MNRSDSNSFSWSSFFDSTPTSSSSTRSTGLKTLATRARDVLTSDGAVGFALGSAATLAVTAAYTRFHRRVPNADAVRVLSCLYFSSVSTFDLKC